MTTEDKMIYSKAFKDFRMKARVWSIVAFVAAWASLEAAYKFGKWAVCAEIMKDTIKNAD